MTEEDIIRSIVGLGQTVPRVQRPRIFAEISNWLKDGQLSEAITKRTDTSPDINKAINLIKRALVEVETSEAKTLLEYSVAFTNILEDALNEQATYNNTIKYVVTQPDYIKEVEQAAANASLWGGSLFDAISNIIRNSTTSIDIINPYWSVNSVERLLKGFENRKIHFRILTLMTDNTKSKNMVAINAFVKRVQNAGSTIEIFSPTEDQVASTDAIAPIHAKLIICDNNVAYIGSANLSKGGLQNGLEIGAIHKGPALKPLIKYVQWLFKHSARYSPY